MVNALTEELCRLAPFESAQDAELALISSLETLGSVLPEHLVRELVAALPAACARPLTAGRTVRRDNAALAQNEKMLPAGGQAVERVQEVCAVLARHLPPPLVADLVRELPPALAAVFDGSGVRSAREAQRVLGPDSGRHLSSAKVGSAHPLASGRPGGPQQDSVAARNPHGDTKLSSARGLTQEREGESLAETSVQRARRKQ